MKYYGGVPANLDDPARDDQYLDLPLVNSTGDSNGSQVVSTPNYGSQQPKHDQQRLPPKHPRMARETTSWGVHHV